mgnify:CR=1 FL=1
MAQTLVPPGHHRLDALKRARHCAVDGQDAGVGVEAAQHLADQHAGQGQVGAEGGAPIHLVGAARPQRARADPPVVAGFPVHGRSFRISAAVARTDRMILS